MFNNIQEAAQLSVLARKEKREKGMSLYKTGWADDSYWQELVKEASEATGKKLKLPQHHMPPSGIKLDKLAQLLGVELGETFFGVGYKNTSNAIRKENDARPDGSKYNFRMYYGLVLELWKEKQNVCVDCNLH